MKAHQRVFVETNGPGPWPCHGCDLPVDPDELCVHHLDEDHGNDVPENLVAMHLPCHTRLHIAGKSKSEEHRRKLSDALRSRPHSEKARESSHGKKLPPFTDEHKRKIGDANRGRVHSAASRAAMSAGWARRKARLMEEES